MPILWTLRSTPPPIFASVKDLAPRFRTSISNLDFRINSRDPCYWWRASIQGYRRTGADFAGRYASPAFRDLRSAHARGIPNYHRYSGKRRPLTHQNVHHYSEIAQRDRNEESRIGPAVHILDTQQETILKRVHIDGVRQGRTVFRQNSPCVITFGFGNVKTSPSPPLARHAKSASSL